jgi:beta-phosphoglucomutase-like phosphatase (HAD superfamily)
VIKKLVIFDIEGTLIDCVTQSLICWREAFAACGYEFTNEQLQRQPGRDPDEMIRLCFLGLPVSGWRSVSKRRRGYAIGSGIFPT